MSERQRRRREKRRREAARKPRRDRIAAGAGITAGAVFALGGSAQAAVDTITVTSTADPGDGNCATNGCTLREAISQANDGDTADQDQIVFQAGLTGTITLNGTQLPTIDEPLYVDGPGAGNLTVTADADGDPYTGPPPSRIFSVSGSGGMDVTIEGLTLTNGYAYTGSGGAIYKTTNSGVDLTVSNSTVSGNYAGVEGGGIGGDYGDFGTTTIVNSTITDNGAGRNGGGIKENVGGTITITDSTISGNFAGNSGGGLDAEAATATINSSTISGNDAHTGGGISAGDTVNVNDSTISGNIGGGVRAYGLTVRRSTIAGNYFGGINAYGTPILINTVVADNAAGPFHDLSGGGPVDAGFSLIEDPGTTTVSPTGPNVIGSDPQLGPLAANGGPTQTMKPASTSPAIDQGSAVTTNDQRGTGFARVFDVPGITNAAGGNGADIGALELQSSEYVPPTPPPTPTPTPAPATPAPAPAFNLKAAIKKCKKKFRKGPKRTKCIKKAKRRAQAG